MTGLHLSQYRIDAELGRGGMGIVYKAEDTKLDRTVAIKVLPPYALSSEEDRARFYREARAAARLNHAHICHVYQVDEAVLVEEGSKPAPDAEKRPFIAMEFVDGESLADRVAKGPLKLEEAIRIASEVARGLGAAHEADIVHRDVKCGNVMLTAKGEAKVLDFGLAKTAASTQLTRQGSTLGTVAYMSPEQARGEEVDQRTDLWALGVVLYEMVAGRLPFAADYEQAALYGILNEDPEPLTAVRTGVPMGLERIVQKLLAKAPGERYQGTTDLLVDLKTIDLRGAKPQSATAQRPAVEARHEPGRRNTSVWVWALSGLLVGAALAAAVFAILDRSDVRASVPVHAQINLPDGVTLEPGLMAPLQLPRPALALSPDGSSLAIVGSFEESTSLYVREMARGGFTRLSGTDGAYGVTFSPDGSRLAFYSGDRLKTVPVSGGSPRDVARVALPYQMVWLPNDRIVFSNNEGATVDVVRISEGVVRTLHLVDEDGMEWSKYGGRPYQLLPNGRLLAANSSEDVLIDLDALRFEQISPTPLHPLLVAPEIVAFREGSGLVVARGEQDTGRPTGASATLLDSLYKRSGVPLMAASSNGIVVAARGPDMAQTVFTWVSANGAEERLSTGVEEWGDFDISPDGNRVAARASTVTGSDIWVHDIARGTGTRLTSQGHNSFVVWAPDGRSVFYRRDDAGGTIVLRQPVDGLSDAEQVLSGDVSPVFVSPDERYLGVTYLGSSGIDVGYVDLRDPGEIMPIAANDQASELLSHMSHDGSLVAYTSSQTDAYEVYVQPFPPDGRVWMVSVGGGEEPVFSADDRQLYFRNGDRLYRVEVTRTSDEPIFGEPTLVYNRAFENVPGFSYDVSPTDSRILLLRSAVEPRPVTTLEVFTDVAALVEN